MRTSLDHSRVDVLLRRQPRLEHPNGRAQVRDEEGVDDESGPIGGLDGGFAEDFGDERRRGLGDLGVGEHRGDDLDERLHGRRVEEVDPEDAFGPRGGLGEADDRHRRGVRGEDRGRVGDDLVELGEDRLLDVLVLARGLDDELPVGEIGDVGGEPQTRQRRLRLGGRELALLHGLGQGLLDPSATGGNRVVADLGDDDVAAGLREHLGDARPHEPAADDGGACDDHIVLLLVVLRLCCVRRRCCVRCGHEARNHDDERIAFMASRRRSPGSVWM